jgi:kinetochore protein NDC80
VETDLQTRQEKLAAAKEELKNLETSEVSSTLTEIHPVPQSDQPPLKAIERENATLVRDREKFLAILRRYESRGEKYREAIKHETAELEELGTIIRGRRLFDIFIDIVSGAKLDNLTRTHQQLTGIVREQNLSPQEVAKMKNDAEQLSRTLEESRQRLADTHRNSMNLEVSVANKTATVEDALEKYTRLLESLELYPTPPPPRHDVNLALELNPAAPAPQDLLQGADIRKVIKPTLGAIAEDKRVERAGLESDKIRVEDELDQVMQDCENLDEEVMTVEKKVMGLNDQAEELRDVNQLLAINPSFTQSIFDSSRSLNETDL